MGYKNLGHKHESKSQVVGFGKSPADKASNYNKSKAPFSGDLWMDYDDNEHFVNSPKTKKKE